jgi:hypothetical protein
MKKFFKLILAVFCFFAANSIVNANKPPTESQEDIPALSDDGGPFRIDVCSWSSDDYEKWVKIQLAEAKEKKEDKVFLEKITKQLRYLIKNGGMSTSVGKNRVTPYIVDLIAIFTQAKIAPSLLAEILNLFTKNNKRLDTRRGRPTREGRSGFADSTLFSLANIFPPPMGTTRRKQIGKAMKQANLQTLSGAPEWAKPITND